MAPVAFVNGLLQAPGGYFAHSRQRTSLVCAGSRGDVVLRRRERTRVPCVRSAAALRMSNEEQKLAKDVAPSMAVGKGAQEINFKRASVVFWKLGWIAFWLQLALTIVSAVILGFALAFPSVEGSVSINGITKLAMVFTTVGACFSIVAILWTYGYTRIGYRCMLQLKDIANQRDKISRPFISRSLYVGTLVCLAGLLATVIGLQGLNGTLLTRIFTNTNRYSSGAYANLTASLQPIDLLVIQAASNSLLSLLIGLIVTLWLKTHKVPKSVVIHSVSVPSTLLATCMRQMQRSRQVQ
ncbi:Protein TIC 21, chloroplastic [Porphyridium purpureum]|uniref:Protein TIC 21, chloroplastic n=1 Tax=Porphyridium purpureum TaxID=35688 RepID=A0A5J4YWR5_PORPP|nr:Protein TIC 21, chloroplastic [Porphyridium purpureum]|eukprot:POR0116..scf227_4